MYAEASGDIWMVHELVLLHGEVAIDRQCAVYFVQKRILGICSIIRNEDTVKRG